MLQVKYLKEVLERLERLSFIKGIEIGSIENNDVDLFLILTIEPWDIHYTSIIVDTIDDFVWEIYEQTGEFIGIAFDWKKNDEPVMTATK